MKASIEWMIPAINLDDMQNRGRWSPGVAYCTGKLANVLFARALSQRLAGDGIVAHAVHPGAVDSNFFSYAPADTQERTKNIPKFTEEEGADTLVWLATSEEGGRASGPLAGDLAWSFRNNPSLVREVKQALADHGVRVSLGEGFLILPGRDIAEAEADFDLMTELGAERLNACAMEPDAARNLDQFAAFAAMAHARGLPVTVEFMPRTPVGDLGAALAFVTASGASNASVLVDATHLFCSGGTVEELAGVAPGLITYAQLCDAKQASFYETYFQDARNNRLIPGEGVLPLAEFVRALPTACPIGLEVPMMAKAQAGVGHEERLAVSLAAARALLASA